MDCRSRCGLYAHSENTGDENTKARQVMRCQCTKYIKVATVNPLTLHSPPEGEKGIRTHSNAVLSRFWVVSLALIGFATSF
jgi:hypothetical protein